MFFIFLISVGVQAQTVNNKSQLSADSVVKPQINPAVKTLIVQTLDTIKLKPFRPDPIKSVWMGAIIPGYGQILNKKYWKLPIVYGGFLGCAYAITWNSGMYNSYKTAYLDIHRYNNDENYRTIVDKNTSVVSFYQIIPKGYTISDFGSSADYENKLNSQQSFYRRYRDLSIIATIGFYALTLVDAYVDAQLYDFDISPDLSMHLQPTLLQNGHGNSFAMQCNISLR